MKKSILIIMAIVMLMIPLTLAYPDEYCWVMNGGTVCMNGNTSFNNATSSNSSNYWDDINDPSDFGTCGTGQYIYGFLSNGTAQCRADISGGSGYWKNDTPTSVTTIVGIDLVNTTQDDYLVNSLNSTNVMYQSGNEVCDISGNCGSGDNESWNESGWNAVYGNQVNLTLTQVVSNIGNFSAENSSIARTGVCISGEIVQNTTTGGVECVAIEDIEQDPIFLGQDNSLARVGTCADGYVVQNTTNLGVECVQATVDLSAYNTTSELDTLFYSILNPNAFINMTNLSAYNTTVELYSVFLNTTDQRYNDTLAITSVNNTLNSDYYNSSEVDALIPSLLTYYFWDVNSTVNNTYKIMNTTQNPTQTNHSASNLNNGDVIVWRLNENTNLTGLSSGQLHLHTTATKISGTEDLQIIGKLSKLHTNGTIVLLATTDTSPILSTGVTTNINLFASLSQQTLNVTDRLLWRLEAVVSGSGTAPSVNITVGGMSQNGLDLPIDLTSIVIIETDPVAVPLISGIQTNITSMNNATIVHYGDANKTLSYCGNITGATSDLCTLIDTDTNSAANTTAINGTLNTVITNLSSIGNLTEARTNIAFENETNTFTQTQYLFNSSQRIQSNGTCMWFNNTYSNTIFSIGC